jgi:hypothetical protein
MGNIGMDGPERAFGSKLPFFVKRGTTMKKTKHLAALGLIGFLAFLMGCGSGEGPLGNTPPQGRPDWMKKDTTPPPPAAPQKQE